ncbi:MAG: DNA-3-methyladenine glycosylase 2 family protein [Alphaproteobacteria bacterium]|nr:DNA-3-methyladenine glycosylase 2 family protein [Alphaproteobacteria bacterium]MBF0393456.1 DNA-3-methyladenine glycosylase 2 family protein [Alphaproteobacteria bacterium]
MAHTADFQARLGEATARLNEREPAFAAVIAQAGPCALSPAWDRPPYESLVRAITYQQIHGRAAAAILGRLLALYDPSPFPAPQDILATDEDALRAVGLSRNKIAAIRDVALKTTQGVVPGRAEAETLDDDEIVRRLVTIRGVGRWTVEMLLIFTLGRLDVFPLDDLGVKAGYAALFGLPAMPTRRALHSAAEAWRPHRSVAAWYLWRAAEGGGAPAVLAAGRASPI